MRNIKLILLGMVGAVGFALIGCANNSYREELEGFHQGFVMSWGPEKNWTPRQLLIFMRELQRYQRAHVEGRAYYPSIPADPIPTPAPPNYRLVPDGAGGYTAIPF